MGQYIGKRVELTKRVSSRDVGERGTITIDEKIDGYVEGVIEVKLDSGYTCNPWAPWTDDAECKWTEEETKSNVGRRVRLLGTYSEHVGIKEATVVEELEYTLRVKEGAREAMPYKPGGVCTPQCEYIEETVQEYNIENIRGKKIAVNCKTQEKFNQVYPIMDGEQDKGRFNGTEWKEYKEETCMAHNGTKKHATGFSSMQYYKKEGYKIITASEFLRDNKKDNTMTTTEKIEALQAQIDALKEELNWKPKVGDWVYVVKVCGTSDNKVGEIRQVVEQKIGCVGREENIPISRLGDKGARWEDNRDLRKATPAEVEKAKAEQAVRVVKIGSDNRQVTIKKDSIVAGGETVDIGDIDRLLNTMTGGAKKVNNWTTQVHSIDIGCCKGVTADQLKEIQRIYKELNA